MKTYAPNAKTYVANAVDRERNWLVVDANGQTLGRLATQIADALRGKRKPEYTPHVDTGDFVIVVNAEKISVTGNKRREKLYRRHSGYPGGLKERTLEEMLERRPESGQRDSHPAAPSPRPPGSGRGWGPPGCRRAAASRALRPPWPYSVWSQPLRTKVS